MKTKTIILAILMAGVLYMFLASFGVYTVEVLNCTFNSAAPCKVGTGGWLIYSK